MSSFLVSHLRVTICEKTLTDHIYIFVMIFKFQLSERALKQHLKKTKKIVKQFFPVILTIC